MKVLFITYYWPPAGGVSPQRILHFVKNLSELDVECHVIHPSGASYYQTDPSLKQLIPEQIVLHPIKIKDITSLVKKVPKLNAEGNIKSESKGLVNKISKWLRANLFIPDPKANWVSPVVKKASKLIKEEKYDAIFTNGTPHSVHLAGLKLKKDFGIPWIADFRDPWTNMDYFDKLPLTKSSLKKHKLLEATVLGNTDITLTVSHQWKKDFEELGAKRAEFITNGFDEYIHSTKNVNEFLISHVGSLHGDRNLSMALDAISKLIDEEQASDPKTKLVLVGNVATETLKLCQSKIKKDSLITTGVVDHNTAKAWIGKSHALLLPINQTQDANGRIPAKLFEYLSSITPIVVLGTKTGDAAEIVKTTQSGKCFESNESESLLKFLKSIKLGEYQLKENKEQIENYSRLSLAKQLKVLLKSLI